MDPRNFLEGCIGAEAFRKDAQATDFLRKSPLLPVKLDRKKAARDTFWECEKQCFATNQFLDLLRYPSTTESVAETRLRQILLKAAKIAKRILGPVPDTLEGVFGPGTSFELKGQAYSTLADKMWITPHVTEACMPVFEHLYWPTLWGRERLRFGLPLPATCRGNRFTTVPKDATKDRGICVEPLGNLWAQLGIGRYLKRRLADVGLRVARSRAPDCPIQRMQAAQPLTGQEIHQRLAREGSSLGSWATIDLSNASDTVALELVRWVIPPDWFELLYACRSHNTLLDGSWVRLDKFSSMGNGFTFELETLLFASILEATTGARTGQDLFVYGDDIVIPGQFGLDAMAILRACGFSPNMQKSFLSGPFRESCGGDFFSGWHVRPYSANGTLRSPLEWVAMHNELLRRWGPTLAAKRCVDAVPLKLRVFGPKYLGHRVFWGKPHRTWFEDGCEWVATIRSSVRGIPLERWGTEFTLCLALLGASSRGLVPRDFPLDYRLSRASIS
jgi:hypothetical protein